MATTRTAAKAAARTMKSPVSRIPPIPETLERSATAELAVIRDRRHASRVAPRRDDIPAARGSLTSPDAPNTSSTWSSAGERGARAVAPNGACGGVPGVGLEPTVPHGQPFLRGPTLPVCLPGPCASIVRNRPATLMGATSRSLSGSTGAVTFRVEASALQHAGSAGLHGRSPLLRLQSDERLVALVRRGNQAAFEALVGRYQSRLRAFCRHMLSSKEDAEDVLQ